MCVRVDSMGPKRNKSKNNNTNFDDDEITLLKQQLQELSAKLETVSNENDLLKERVEVLESRVEIGKNTSTKLRIEIDRLDQYQRRSNLIFKNVILPPNQSDEGDTEFVKNLLEKEMNMQNAFSGVDKLHRTGKRRTATGGKKTQDVIVRFKSHSARYKVYKERNKSKSVKIRPNLTRRRGDLLYRASNLVDDLDQIDFVFANIHGDLTLRLKDPDEDEKQLFSFSSMSQLKETLKEHNIDFMDDENADDME